LFIQINTDNQIDADGFDVEAAEARVRERLARFESRITDVQIHVSDVNGPRGGAADLRCTLEARLAGIDPVAVHEHGSTIDRAIAGAAAKAVRALDHSIGRLNDRARA
jgi:hypothetical protein